MIKKAFYLFVAIGFMSLHSCKKEETKPETSVQPTSAASGKIEGEITPLNQTPPPPTSPANGKLTEITFEKLEHDFGVINEGDKVNYTFKFKNTGKNDLYITRAQGSCGCTVPEYPKEAIKPGTTDKIKVSFDSTHKKGDVTKTVTLQVNTPKGSEVLTIKASINKMDSKAESKK